MTSKQLTVRRELRKEIHNYSNYGESVDETVNRLIQEAGDISDIDPALTGSTGIKVSPETEAKLNDLKFQGESYSSVLERLFKKVS